MVTSMQTTTEIPVHPLVAIEAQARADFKAGRGLRIDPSWSSAGKAVYRGVWSDLIEKGQEAFRRCYDKGLIDF